MIADTRWINAPRDMQDSHVSTLRSLEMLRVHKLVLVLRLETDCNTFLHRINSCIVPHFSAQRTCACIYVHTELVDATIVTVPDRKSPGWIEFETSKLAILLEHEEMACS